NLTIEQYDDLVQDFYTGTALNAQSGYVFKNNFELAARYTQVRPLEETSFNDLTDYTFALSKYIVGHKFKVQTDFVIRKEENKPITHIYRLQLELSF
ncbi:MAG: FmdC precursor, partial [Cyclobacteriaceae bacterium]|nr:FmdC precursor [Cyclobacteriaceae bacterium]